MKCQKVNTGHIAAACRSVTDICGTCGGAHWTNECTVTRQDDHYCNNCQMKGHAAWSRDCSHFKRKLQEMREQTPEAALRFFPNQLKPATWEMKDWTPAIARRPPAVTPPASQHQQPTPPATNNNSSQPLRQPPPHQAHRGRKPTDDRFRRRDSGSRERAQSRRASQTQAPPQARPASTNAKSRSQGRQQTLWDVVENAKAKKGQGEEKREKGARSGKGKGKETEAAEREEGEEREGEEDGGAGEDDEENVEHLISNPPASSSNE